MSYVVKTVIGAALFIAAVVLFNVELVKLLDTGTCASGGPYVSARQCPEGTGTSILLLMASLFAGLIGAGIFAWRGARAGDPNQGKGSGRNAGMLTWSIFFTATGAVALHYALTADDPGPGAQLGALIVGGTFLLMGLPALLWMIYAWIDDRRNPAPDPRFAASPGASVTAAPVRTYVPPSPAPAPVPQPQTDTVSQLERLQRLRESGALTDAEFETQKRRLLDR